MFNLERHDIYLVVFAKFIIKIIFLFKKIIVAIEIQIKFINKKKSCKTAHIRNII